LVTTLLKMPGYFLVLPIAHGKSYNHNPNASIHEADSVVNCNSTPELKALRDKAKATGEWEAFDKVWGKAIEEKLGSEGILLVPDITVGWAAGRNYFLGVYLLEEAVWRANMIGRGDDPEKWLWHYNHIKEKYSHSTRLFKCNDDLAKAVRETGETYQDKDEISDEDLGMQEDMTGADY